MTMINKGLVAGAAAAVLGFTAAAPASATDLFPADAKLEWSVNGGIMSDYVFRGFSQNDNDASFFAGADIKYGIFYAGIWAAMVDPTFVGGASAEVDYYAGITPSIGPVDFDFGVIVYHYPNSDTPDPTGGDITNSDYVELKAGVSGEFVKNLSTGITYYYSPEYTLVRTEAHVLELAAGYTLPKVWIFEPTIDGTYGFLFSGDENLLAEYNYWNAGISLAVEALTLDFRYWDTDVENDGLATNGDNLADERFVFTATVALP